MTKQNKQAMYRMTLGRRRGWILALLMTLTVTTVPISLEAQNEAQSQMVRTLVIKNNQVIIDGRPVESDHLSGAVDLSDITVSYSFVGIDIPVVSIGEQLFAVQENELTPIEFRGQHRDVFSQEKKMEQIGPESKGWIVDFDRGEYYTFQGERLELGEAVPRLLHDANNLYLEDLQKENQRLFSRLSREQDLERQAEFLARAARRAQTDNERSQHVAELTKKLNEIFELKQQNRLAEIEQFEAELDALKLRVEKREQLKEEIIRSRLVRLIGIDP